MLQKTLHFQNPGIGAVARSITDTLIAACMVVHKGLITPSVPTGILTNLISWLHSELAQANRGE